MINILQILHDHLIVRGDFSDAADVKKLMDAEPAKKPREESIPPSEPIPEPTHAAPPAEQHSDPGSRFADRSTDSGCSQSSGASSSSSSASVSESGNSSGGGGGGGSHDQGGEHGHGGGGGGHGGEHDGEHTEQHGAGHGAEQKHEKNQGDPKLPDPDWAHQKIPEPISSDDPLATIYSDYMRSKIEREAFAGASPTAQDSAISARAEEFLAALQHKINNPHDDPTMFVRSREELLAMRDALHGEIPAWAKGDPNNDPVLIRAAEQKAAGRVSDPTPERAPDRTPLVSSPSIARTAGRELDR